MPDIETFEDLQKLVSNFYDQAKKDESLGIIFNKFVDDWDPHIRKVASFWEITLFSKGSYKGNPISIHQKVDDELKNTLERTHFDRWVEIWNQTVDSMFTGRNADIVKQRAINIANIMYIKIHQVRN